MYISNYKSLDEVLKLLSVGPAGAQSNPNYQADIAYRRSPSRQMNALVFIRPRDRTSCWDSRAVLNAIFCLYYCVYFVPFYVF